MNKRIIKNDTLPYLSIDEIVSLISSSYIKLINNKLSPFLLPPTMLWGPPGVGKSDGVREIAKEIENETNKKVVVSDVRLNLFNPVDLRGIPTFNKDRTLAIWLKPKVFDMDESNEIINILFLDEITSASPSVQAAAYQITLDRKIGEHLLPNNCIILLAGNRVTDQSVAFKMPKALANRLMHFEVRVDFNSFKRWAIQKGINEKVIGFLSYNEENLMKFSSDDESLAFATPRSWEKASNVLNFIESDVKKAENLISSLISVGLTKEFIKYSTIYRKLPNIENIFLGKGKSDLKNIDELYALVSAMTSYAFKHQDELEKINNSIDFAIHFLPPDFTYLLLDNYSSFNSEYKNKLLKLDSYLNFIRKRGNLFNE